MGQAGRASAISPKNFVSRELTTVPNAPIATSFEAESHLALRLGSETAIEPGGDFFHVVGILSYVQEVVIRS